MWPESSASSAMAASAANISTGVPSLYRRLSPFWITVTKSRVPLGDRVALARVARVAVAFADCWWSAAVSNSVQVWPVGPMTMAPTSPFCPCLIMSAGARLVPPNSTGVATML